jgi:hypothetical protein
VDIEYEKLKDPEELRRVVYKLNEFINYLEIQLKQMDLRIEDHERRLDAGGL